MTELETNSKTEDRSTQPIEIIRRCYHIALSEKENNKKESKGKINTKICIKKKNKRQTNTQKNAIKIDNKICLRKTNKKKEYIKEYEK